VVPRSSTEVLSRRDLALLHAVADRRCEIQHGRESVLFVDGRVCCDAEVGRRLIDSGLLAQTGLGMGRWPARLSEAGKAKLARGECQRQPNFDQVAAT
jgi:hypothetical protein